jgi:predicted ATPase
MAKIHNLSISNFRGIQFFSQGFNSNFICLIGRGDSGKSTIIEAIACVLSPNWNLSFFDNDFYKCDTSKSIQIEVTLRDVPNELLLENKYGLYVRGLTKTGEVVDELEDDQESVLTIRLEVQKDLEPEWNVITGREIEPKHISANDRSMLGVFLVSDYLDRHFTWSKGSPLYTLLKQESLTETEEDDVMIEALREAKGKIDGNPFNKFNSVVGKIKDNAATLGLDISKTTTTIDFKDIVIKDGKVCLHDENIPFRLKGKGSKRLISMAIQASIADAGGIVLIDEIEQGLEPDRVQHLVNTLKTNNHGQVFITSHSRDVLVELSHTDLFLMKKGAQGLVTFDDDLQGCLRKNPEAFFAKKIVVCEGATEIGICRALNRWRINKGLQNTAYLGVRFADGTGSESIKYCKGFNKSGFPVCLFCDSDTQSSKDKKSMLQGIPIFDWNTGDCLEVAILKDIPFELIVRVFELAVGIAHDEDSSLPITAIKTAMWDSVRAQFGPGCPQDIDSITDTVALRNALGKAAAKKGNDWFKSQTSGVRLGKLIFDNFDQINDESLLKKQLVALSNWIDANGS